jgi:E3 ubiquitin-protein ligase TRIP12
LIKWCLTPFHDHSDSKRSSPSLLARQLRLRLVAGDDSDVPRNLHNIVVSIHAIATFQALHDYLRPRVAGLLSSGRLSGMLAALAASGFSPGSSSRSIAEELRQPPPIIKAAPESSTATAASSSIGRRRSLRLSAKIAGTSSVSNGETNPSQVAAGDTESDHSTHLPASTRSGFPAEAATSDTVVDSELQAEFTDDEVDAEVTLSFHENIPCLLRPTVRFLMMKSM